MGSAQKIFEVGRNPLTKSFKNICEYDNFVFNVYIVKPTPKYTSPFLTVLVLPILIAMSIIAR